MPSERGRYLSLPLPRRWVGDLLHASRNVPLVPFERRMNLAPVVAARRLVEPAPSWCALFTRAYSLVAARRPELRRAYLSFPWPRLYEHPESIACVAVERTWRDEPAVFFALLREPEYQPIPQLDGHLRHYKGVPIESVGTFRRLIRTTHVPRPLRRFLWWQALNVSGPKRARNFGTFGVSVTAGMGASALQLICPLTTTLYYGTLAADGSLDVRLTFDHRVLDGGPAARALGDLEETLCTDIVRELHDAAERPGLSAA